MTALQEIRALGQCPACKAQLSDNRPQYVRCSCCGVHGDPERIPWCERVPVFHTPVPPWHSGQVYEHDGKQMILAGYAPGCGRVVIGTYCDSCRDFMPELAAMKSSSIGRKTGRKSGGGENSL